MTEADRTQLLSRVFDVIRKRSAELRKTGDFYDGAYSADELVRLPRYIAPRLDAGLASDAVVITRKEFDTSATACGGGMLRVPISTGWTA